MATEGGKVAPALDLFNLTEDSETEGLGFMALESEGLQGGVYAFLRSIIYF